MNNTIYYIAETAAWIILMDFIWTELELFFYGETHASIEDLIMSIIFANIIMYYKYFH